jgi:molybdate transport system substrate-binding protein
MALCWVRTMKSRKQNNVRWLQVASATLLAVSLCLVAVNVAAHATDLSLSEEIAAPAPQTLPALNVAAAADLQFAMQDLAAQFEKMNVATVHVTYGSSGNFFTQIQNGAPFDLFFSADIDYVRKLDDANLTVSGTSGIYAIGRLVLWTRAEAPVDVTKDGWKALLDPRVEKIAIANPAHAPYGKAAEAALHSAEIYDQVKSKLVFGENISQTAQFVQTGNAQAGLVALSLAVSPGMKGGKRWEVPPDAYPPIEQGAVVLRSSKNQAAARAFLDFVRSASGRETLKRYGFSFPPSDK